MTALGFIYCEYTSFSRFRFFVKIHTVCYWPCARLFFYHLSFSSFIIIISWGRIFLFFCNVDEAKKKRKKNFPLGLGSTTQTRCGSEVVVDTCGLFFSPFFLDEWNMIL